MADHFRGIPTVLAVCLILGLWLAQGATAQKPSAKVPASADAQVRAALADAIKRLDDGDTRGFLEYYFPAEHLRQLRQQNAVEQTADRLKQQPEILDGIRNRLRKAAMNYSGNFAPVSPPRWMPDGLTEFWPGQAPTMVETGGLAFLNSRIRIADIPDGTAMTLLLGERSATGGAAIWMGVRGNEFETDQVSDCSHGHEINSGEAGFSSRHEGGANFLFCDGSVRFLSEQIESGSGEKSQMKTYQKLSHRSDGMPIGDF